MTPFQLLAAKLSDNEISELTAALRRETVERMARRVTDFPELNAGERIVAHEDKFKAIKRYRERVGTTLMEAKTMVEKYLESYHPMLTDLEMKLLKEGTGAGATDLIIERLGLSRPQAVKIVEAARRASG